MKIYISGKVTGLNYEATVDKFALAQARLMHRHPNAIIENPIAITAHIPQSEKWQTFMRECIKVLTQCTHIYMLPCWTDSHGAALELQVARACGLTIIFEKQ